MVSGVVEVSDMASEYVVNITISGTDEPGLWSAVAKIQLPIEDDEDDDEVVAYEVSGDFRAETMPEVAAAALEVLLTEAFGEDDDEDES